jgi:hypothetical protein
MARTEIYPWTTLESVGDYFFVLSEFRDYYHMNATVAQRNKHYSGRMKYACVRTTYGSLIVLAQVHSDTPTHDYEVVEGVYAKSAATEPGEGDVRTQVLGKRPEVRRQLTQQERISRMPRGVRLANLPWWWEGTDFVWNVGVRRRPEDVESYMSGNFKFGPNDPYPEFYRLDENFVRRGDQDSPVDDVEDEEDMWAGYSADGKPPEGD